MPAGEPSTQRHEPSHPDADSAPGAVRTNVFTLPTETTFLFVLLMTAIGLSTLIYFRTAYPITPAGRAWVQTLTACAQEHDQTASAGSVVDFPSLVDTVTAMERDVESWQACLAPSNQRQALWLAGVLVVVFATGLALHLAHPAWYRRRHRLRRFLPEDAAALLAELDRLRTQAGVGPLEFVSQPFNPVPSAFTLGPPRRRKLVVSGGLAVRFHTDPPAFRAIVLHELAHLRNRDIDQTYLALALTIAFTVVSTGFVGWVTVLGAARSRLPIEYSGLVVRAVGLDLLAVVLLAALVRSREYHADARVLTFGADGAALTRVLERMPAPPRRLLAGLRALHPTPAQRVRALADPRPLLGLTFWNGFAGGLLATIGLYTVANTANLFVGDLVDAPWLSVGAGLLVAALVVVGHWRIEAVGPSAAAGRTWRLRTWPFSLGLATGAALGPVASLDFWPRDASPVTVLAWTPGWVLLCVVVVGPVTAWVAEGVSGWWALTHRRAPAPDQEIAPDLEIAPDEVPVLSQAPTRGRARGRAELLAAVAVVTGIFAVLLHQIVLAFLALAPHDAKQGVLSALATLVFVPVVPLATLPTTGPVLVGTVAALVGLFTVSVVAAGIRTRRRGPDRRVLPLELRGALRACGGGAAATVALVLAAGLAAHRLPLVDRWGNGFVLRFDVIMMAVIDLTAVVTGFVVAHRARRWPLTSGALAALGCAGGGVVGMVVVAQPMLGSCAEVLVLRPAFHGCVSLPPWNGVWLFVWTLVGVTALVIVLLLPPYCGLRRGFGRGRTPRPAPSAAVSSGRATRRWAGVAVAIVVAVLAGQSVPLLSRDGEVARAGATIGDRGWVGAPGFRLRMLPGWLDVTRTDPEVAANHGLSLRLGGFAFRTRLTVSRTTQYPLDQAVSIMLSKGGHRTTVAGARAAVLDTSDDAKNPDRTRFILVEHGDEQLLVALTTRRAEWDSSLHDLDRMLATWRWQP